MIRIALFLLLATPAIAAADAGCSVSGTAYASDGRPLDAAVVRLTDLDTRASVFGAAGRDASFAFVAPAAGGRYRLDLLGAPTRVTGSHIPVRSVLGRSPPFACLAGQPAHQDVRAGPD
jgi:hypothetical protein